MRPWPIVVFLSAFLAVACQSGSHSHQASAGQPVTAPERFSTIELAEAMAQVLCDAYARCQLDLRPRLVFFPDICVSELTSRYVEQFRLIEPALSNMRIVYQPAQFERCLRAISTGSCEAVDHQRFEEECDGSFLGQVPLNQACTLDAECDGGYCPGADGCAHRCTEQSEQGEPCDVDGPVQCKVGLDCGFDQICQPKLVAAALADEGQLCARNRCRAGLRCVPNPEPICLAYTKMYVLKEGDECPPFDAPLNAERCRPPLVCQYTDKDAQSVGGRCSVRPARGESCALTFGDRTLHCEADSFCAELDPAKGIVTGACTVRPDVGQPCGQFYGFPSICRGGLICLNGRCSFPLSAGETCTHSSECGGGQCVDAECQLACVDRSMP